MRRGEAGMTLLEVVVAVAIIASTLVALQATMSGHLFRAGDAIKHRAARALCRTKLAEVLLGVEQQSSGDFESDEKAQVYPGFSWSAEKKDITVGAAESETVVEVTVTVTYPVDDAAAAAGSGEGEETDPESGSGTASFSLSSYMDPEQPAAGGE